MKKPTVKSMGNTTPVQPERPRGRPEKPLKIDDTPENVARALWGERSTKFPKKVS